MKNLLILYEKAMKNLHVQMNMRNVTKGNIRNNLDTVSINMILVMLLFLFNGFNHALTLK